jgi:hypothetical protein
MAEDIDYQKVVDELDRQNFNAMEEKIEELEELINSLRKRVKQLEKTVAFHEAIRRR